MLNRILLKIIGLTYKRKYNMSTGGANAYAQKVLRDYRNRKISFGEVLSIHRKGFLVNDWIVMEGLTEKNYQIYLSNAEYWAMHPINGRFSAWIDDKLTLKYLCAGTILDKYMPEYYFHIDGRGRILALMDVEYQGEVDAEVVLKVLKNKGLLAIKLLCGSIGKGFYRAEYRDSTYYLNGTAINEQAFLQQIRELRNYLVIEYLRPHKETAEFCPNVTNCFRYLAARIDGKLEMIKGYIRFGTIASGFVENYNVGGVLCFLDEDGYFKEGNVIDSIMGTNKVIKEHPDTHKILDGRIPCWDEVIQAVYEFDLHFPQLKFLGFDFVITHDNKVKILEINSLTSLDTIQIDKPVTQTRCNMFFKKIV